MNCIWSRLYILIVLADNLLTIVKESQKFIKTSNSKYVYRNELAKASFAHDSGDSDSEDLVKRTISR